MTNTRNTRQALLKLNKIMEHLLIKIKFSDDVPAGGAEYIPHKKTNRSYLKIDGPVYGQYFKSKTNIDLHIIRILAHELGHYLVAPPKRRRQKDYGIKTKNISDRSRRKYDIEEIKVQAIEAEIYERLNIKNGLLSGVPDYREDDDVYYDVTKWWKSEGKQLVDSMFYILGV